jgi:hypothetical protein
MTKSANLEVKSSDIAGKGLFATKSFNRGQIVARISGKKVKLLSKTKTESMSIPTWFGLGRYTWLDPANTIFQYLNHSCDPNTAITGTKTIVAIKPIKPGEEINIDYSMTDADPLWEMRCNCRSTKCRHLIKAITSLPTDVVKSHMPYIPRYFQRIYLKHHIRNNGVN